MESNGIFNTTIQVMEKALDLRARKHNLITSNIANMDTPNFKAFELMVEDEMQRAVGNEKTLAMSRTDAGHLEPEGQGREPVISRRQFSEGKPGRADGNTVDLDRSMAALSENSLLYNVSAQIIARKFDGLKNVIAGGK